MKRMIGLGCLAYFMVGLATVAFGALLPELLHSYGKNYADGGRLVFAQFAGFLCGVLLAPGWSVRLGYRRTIWLGMLALVLVHGVLPLQQHWFFVLGLAAVNGLGFGMTQTAIGTLLLESTERPAVTMSRLEVAFGLGALFMPLASGYLIARYPFASAFAVVALFAVINLLLWSSPFVAPRRQAAEASLNDTVMQEESSAISENRRPRFSKLAFFIAFVFLYVGLEISFANFLPSIFAERFQLSSSRATLSVTLFWVAMVIGRLFSGYMAERINYFSFLFCSAAGAALSLAWVAVTKDAIAAYALVFLIGLFLSGIFAMILVYANRVFPGYAKQTTSLLIASGGIGGALLPLLIGWSLEQRQGTGTLWILAGSALLLLACLIRIRVVERARAASRQERLTLS
ncbi:MFS transporter [Paenibacillus arenilitoris]|uniref:MFS transporter n=1 Tax=Paenibacillus arenilitoris TaxID=2772299 RepID=A0A927H7D2_9BACL|nr:MFS transporter [Paenibacillus arenilitoris]MBD2870528.1 MFS transporter [Paenibacillus arenilitoris]